MDSLGQLGDRLRGGWESIHQGVLIGVLLGAVLPLLLYLLLGLMLRRRRCRGVRIDGDGGVLFVSVTAVRELVRQLVDECSDASFHALGLDRRRTGYVFDVSVDVAPGAEMVALREQINEKLRAAAARRLGLNGQVLEVNVIIHRLLTNERKWRRQKGDAIDSEPTPTTRGD